MALVSIGRLHRSTINRQALKARYRVRGEQEKNQEYASQSRDGDSVASGGVCEPLFFCLLNMQVMGVAFFRVKTGFLFTEFSTRYKAKWCPQGEAALSPVAGNFATLADLIIGQ